MLLGEPLEEAAPRRERLTLAAPPIRDNEPGKRTQEVLNPLRIRSVRDHLGDSRVQLLLGLVGGIGLQNPRLRLHHLRQRPEGHAIPIWE